MNESSASGDEDNDDDAVYFKLGPSTSQDVQITKKAFITERLAAALDKYQISDRAAMHVITATAVALGHDIDQLIINRTSIRRYRKSNRVNTVQNIKSNFQVMLRIIVHM